MKKIISLALVAALAMSLVACGAKEEPKVDPTPEPTDAPVAVTYKTGLGVVVSAKGTDLTADKDAKAQVDTTMVAATFDSEDKVVSVTIDVAQQYVTFDAAGKATSEIDARSKMEKGADYGMLVASPIGKEYNEQIPALEAWMVGKTLAEITGAELTTEGDHAGAVVDLSSSCTIVSKAFIEALQKAYDNSVEVEEVVELTGLGAVTSANVKDATAEAGASVQFNTTIASIGLNADKVVGVKMDVAQQTVAFDLDGVYTNETDLRTKVEKGADYGMLVASPIGAELDAQVAALEAWMVGKDAATINGAELTTEGDHAGAVVDLNASCTIVATAYIAAADEAITNAK